MTRHNENNDFAPIFIIGFPRSGTTLLATLLSRHSQIAVPPETRFMEEVADNSGDRLTMLARLANSKRCQDLDLDPDLVATRFANYSPTYSSLFRVLLESYTVEHNKKISAEKSPLHLLHVTTLSKWFPRARFLLIVRDGRDCVLSLLKVSWAHNDLIRHSAEWRRRMQLARRLLKQQPANIHLVRYEDLVLSTEKELRLAMEFLQQPFENTQLLTSTASTAVPEWEAQWKGRAQSLPDCSRVSSWKREATPKAIIKMESVMGRELAAWDYPVENDKASLAAALLGSFYCSDLFRALHRMVRKTRRFSR